MAELMKIRQIGYVEEYHEAFNCIIPRLQLSDDNILSCFLGDGLLSLENFVKIMEDAGEEKLKDLEEAFEMYNDTEMFGFITPKSLQRMLGRLGESKSMEQCTTMIGHFDLNGDGLLCFDEFRVMMQ